MTILSPQMQNDFPTRAAMVTARAAGWVPVDGVTYTAGGLEYRGQAGATVISDLPGLVPNVMLMPQHFGAVANGVADDTVAFQAAINAIPSGGLIQLGYATSFIVNVSALNVTGKLIRWGGSARINGAPMLSLPGLVEQYHPAAQQKIVSLIQTAPNGDPHSRVRRVADYTGTSTASGSALKVETESKAGAGLFEFNLIAEHITDSTEAAAEHCASYNRIVKNAASEVSIWGFALAAINRSEVNAQIVGAEITCRALDDHTNPASPLFQTGRRVVLDVLASTADDLAATRKARYDDAIQITCGNGAIAADVTNGIRVSNFNAAGGTIETALRIETAGVGVLASGGTCALRHVGVSPSGEAAVDLIGSGTSYGLSITGTYQAAMRIGSDLRMQFGNLPAFSMRHNSAGNALQFLHQNSAQIAMQISDVDISNPVMLRVSGTVKRVSEGAVDSGGTGFRCLRVVN